MTNMRRTFAIVLLLALVAGAASASLLTELVFGKHSEQVRAGFTYGIDERVPAAWVNDPALSTRYWKAGQKTFAGTVMDIGALVMNEAPTGRVFTIYVSDPNSVLDYNPDAKRTTEMQTGGLRALGKFVGKYGKVSLDTTNMAPGTYFIYVGADRDGKHQLYSESALAIQIAPSLTAMIPALKNASDATLASWGLEATLQEVIGTPEQDVCKGDVYFTDGGYMKGIQFPSPPEVGKTLVVIHRNTRTRVRKAIGWLDISRVDGNTTYTSSPSWFLKKYQGEEGDCEFRWGIKTALLTAGPVRALDATEERILATFPDGPAGSPVHGLQGMVRAMATAEHPLVHLKSLPGGRYQKNTSAEYQRMFQNWSAVRYGITLEEVPARIAKNVRVIGFAGSTVIIDVSRATISRTDTNGLMGFTFLIRRADRHTTNVSNDTNVDVDQQTDVVTDVDQSVDVDQQQQQEQLLAYN